MKVLVFLQRYRQVVVWILYVIVIAGCLVLLYQPSYLDGIIGNFVDLKPADSGYPDPAARRPSSTPLPRRTLQSLLQLPFTPKNFKCDDMLHDAGTNFTYLESYWVHLDAFKTALALNSLIQMSTSTEHDWILQLIARLPFVENVCESGFGAGATTFQWLAGNEELVVYSFDATARNYSLEMVDFMSIEFPERFFIYPGDVRRTVRAFADKWLGRLKCDVVFVDSSQRGDVIRDNLNDFRRLANRAENLVVLDAHPENVPGSEAHAVWSEFTRAGTIVEHFRCHVGDDTNLGKQTGITVGSFAF